MQNITRFASINPINNKLIKAYDFISNKVLDQKIAKAHEGYKIHRARSFAERGVLLKNMGKLLEENASDIATIMATEMGKPLAVAKGEVMKTASHFKFYAENGVKMLTHKPIQCAAMDAFVAYQPIGPLLCILSPS